MACYLPHVCAHFGHENYRDFFWGEAEEVQHGKGGKGGEWKGREEEEMRRRRDSGPEKRLLVL